MSRRTCRTPAPKGRGRGVSSRRFLVALVACSAATSACARDDLALPTNAGTPIDSVASSAAKRWSDPDTWPGRVLPMAGDTIVIRQGTEVLLDLSPPALGALIIDGALVADDRDLTLTAGSIHVRGTLRAGTERTPFRKRFVITLTGDDPGGDQPSKMIAVYGDGVLDLHGEPRTSWTRLAATAQAGATQLELERAVDWRPGDRVVVASTSFDPAEGEDAVVAEVNGTTVTLSSPLRYAHWGTVQTIAGGTVDERAEVGLLSRNIIVRGDERSEATGFGGHIMMMGGVSRIEGVELVRVGQRGKLARYPIHWHMMGNAPGQYARANSIWRSFNRCVTVHGTNDVSVAANVCYDHLGHGYFLEDGAEVRNTFAGNLGVLTRTPPPGSRLLPTDATPATFWITNPDNSWRENVAAGSEGHGFWFALPEHPTGLSTTTAMRPRHLPLREFAGNVSHSNQHTGLHVDDGPEPDGSARTAFYLPRRDASDPGSEVTAEFRDFVAWKNQVRGVWLRGAQLLMQGGVLADNRIGATFAAWDAYLRDALVVGESDNRTPHPNPNWPVHGFEFYDGPVGPHNVTFANFQPNGTRDAGALGLEFQNWAIMNPGNSSSGLRFANARQVIFPPHLVGDGERMSMFTDRDGTVTGRAGATVTVNNPLLHDGSCTARADWNAYVCPARFVGVNVQALSSWDPLITPLNVKRDDGKATPTMDGYSQRWVALNVPTRRTYTVQYPTRAALGVRIAYDNLADGEWVRLTLPYTYGKFVMHREGDNWIPIAPVESLAELGAAPRATFYYDAAANLLHVKLVAKAGQPAGAVWMETRD